MRLLGLMGTEKANWTHQEFARRQIHRKEDKDIVAETQKLTSETAIKQGSYRNTIQKMKVTSPRHWPWRPWIVLICKAALLPHWSTRKGFEEVGAHCNEWVYASFPSTG